MRLNIGLDFGTSSTKVCVRPALGDGPDVKVYPISFDRAGDDSLFSPSTIACKSGRLYFGWEAERLSGNHPIWRHIKVCVACEAEGSFAGDNCYCSRPGAGRLAIREHFNLNGVIATPTDLASLYLAWALGEIQKAAPQSLRTAGEPIFTCNLGVPVDQIDLGSPLHAAYERIAAMAWRLRGHVGQGIEATTALGWLMAMKQASPASEGAVVLCAETGAAIVAHIASPTTREGMYALVDIGAWTTDISFFRLTDVSTMAEGVRTAAFYEADTHRVAAGRIDQKASELLNENRSEFDRVVSLPSSSGSQQLVFRSIRETGSSPALSTPPAKRVAEGCLECARSVTAAAVSGCFASTRAKAKSKEGPYNHDDWKRLSVFLLGGGAEEPCFQEFLTWSAHEATIARVPNDGRLNIPDNAAAPARARRLQVAAGLSFPTALWPKQFFPSQVERIPTASHTNKARPRPDREELYPK